MSSTSSARPLAIAGRTHTRWSGAVEAALTAGLAGVGVEGGIALSAVLMFRVFTFWLPAIPGWFTFNDLLKKGYL